MNYLYFIFPMGKMMETVLTFKVHFLIICKTAFLTVFMNVKDKSFLTKIVALLILWRKINTSPK